MFSITPPSNSGWTREYIEELEGLLKTCRKNGISSSQLLRDATFTAADHLYSCSCLSCLIFFAFTTKASDDENGPFGAEVMKKARKLVRAYPNMEAQ